MHRSHPTTMAVLYMIPLNKYQGCSQKRLIDIYRIKHLVHLIIEGFLCNRQLNDHANNSWICSYFMLIVKGAFTHELSQTVCHLSFYFVHSKILTSWPIYQLVFMSQCRSLWSPSVSLSGN